LARALGGCDTSSDPLDALSISDRGSPELLDYQTHGGMVAEV